MLRRCGSPILLRRVVGESMMPVFCPGQLIVASGWSRISIGDIIIFDHGGKEKVKRVVALSGDSIEVLGDNLAASTDSRHYGTIDRESVKAVVCWPRY